VLAASVVTPPAPPSSYATAGSQRSAGAEASTAALQTSPYCGDGVCDAGENCANCAQDCKQVGRHALQGWKQPPARGLNPLPLHMSCDF